MLNHLLTIPDGMTIFILPYLSLINEKETKIGSLLKTLNIKFMSVHSHKRPIIPEEDPPRLILCTIEKAN